MARFLHAAHVRMSLYAVGGSRRHRHPVVELIYAVSPGYRVERAGQLLELRPGDVIVFAVEEEHQIRVSADNQTVLHVVQWHPEPGDPPLPSAVVHDFDGRLLMLSRWLNDLDARRAATAERRRQQILDLLLAEVEERSHHGRESLSERSLAFMRRDYRHPLCLEDLAGNFTVSVSHLVRRFRAETGTTPGQALIAIRVERALHLLADTDLSLARIAEQTGFATTGAMSKRIKRATGRTPSQLRGRAVRPD